MTERDALLQALRAQREHVISAVEGLPEAAQRRPLLPSGWTALGLVNHLALDVERFWFRAVTAGETVHLPTGDQAWQVDARTPAAAILDAYRDEAGRADAVILGTPLDAAAAWWPTELFADLPERVLRETVLHVLAETACHAGHLDAACELFDGRQNMVLT